MASNKALEASHYARKGGGAGFPAATIQFGRNDAEL